MASNAIEQGGKARTAMALAPVGPQITQRGLRSGGQRSREWVKGFEMSLWDLKAPCFCSGNNLPISFQAARQSSLGPGVVDQRPGVLQILKNKLICNCTYWASCLKKKKEEERQEWKEIRKLVKVLETKLNGRYTKSV